MRRLVLGTAGHIDHGKTALVKALTGIDTDRLKEEQERGITVDLGFAEYQPEPGVFFGVVDVPGHEGFIRNMLAGATGMDLVLLVVAADEGVMPQTREHLAIVQLLGVPRLAVALTKVDLVDEDWLELVRDDVTDLLSGTPYRSAPLVGVSAKTGTGLQELGRVLADLGGDAEEHRSRDVVRLPIDRVFTIRGTGTVVTGTLWTGTLAKGQRARLLPGDQEGRVRSVQIHGKEVNEAQAGARVAVALKGSDVSHHGLDRGQTLVVGPGWRASKMLTCPVTVLPDTGWGIDHGQRVRVHVGTAEVLARVAVLQGSSLQPGQDGWIQLRLEEPVLARVRDHFVLRSYSPVTTIGGGRVSEVVPRKRRRLTEEDASGLAVRLDGDPDAAIRSLLGTVHTDGVLVENLPHRTGLAPETVSSSAARLVSGGAAHDVEERLVGHTAWAETESAVLARLSTFHKAEPLRPGLALEELRQVTPGAFGPKLADAVIQSLVASGDAITQGGRARLATFVPTLTKEEEGLRGRIQKRLAEADIAPPSAGELGAELASPDGVPAVLQYMELQGEVIGLDGDFYFDAAALVRAGAEVVKGLGGGTELGPADFREVLPVSRRHLLPILRFFDLRGVTTRLGDARSVSASLPPDWMPEGTPGEGEV